jgi:hypothetical protein
LSCFDVLSSKPNLVFDFEIWLILMMYINILLVSSLCLLKVGYKLCSNIYQPHTLIFHCKIHNLMHTLDVKLAWAKLWFAKKCVFRVDECTALLYVNSAMDKRFNQLFWCWLVVHQKYYYKTWLTIWEWKANDNFIFTPNSSKSRFQNLDANLGPWSKKHI